MGSPRTRLSGVEDHNVLQPGLDEMAVGKAVGGVLAGRGMLYRPECEVVVGEFDHDFAVAHAASEVYPRPAQARGPMALHKVLAARQRLATSVGDPGGDRRRPGRS